MPLKLLRRYMSEHDRLDAGESLAAATRVAVGSGRASNRSALMAAWRQALGGDVGPRVDVHDRSGLAHTARFLGVPVRAVKRNG